MDQARFNFLLIMFLIAAIVALISLAYSILAYAKLKAERTRSFEWKQMYLRENGISQKLKSENSILRFNAKNHIALVELGVRGRW